MRLAQKRVELPSAHPPNPKLSAPRSKDAKVVELAARHTEAVHVKAELEAVRCGHVKAAAAAARRAEATGK